MLLYEDVIEKSSAYDIMFMLAGVLSVLRALCQVRRNGLGFGVINRGHCCRYVCPWE